MNMEKVQIAFYFLFRYLYIQIFVYGTNLYSDLGTLMEEVHKFKVISMSI